MTLSTPFHSYSPIMRLDASNDHLLQEYYNLYYNLPQKEKELIGNISFLIEIREKIKLGLKGHLFNLKNGLKTVPQSNIIFEFLPLYLKLEFLMKDKMHDPNAILSYEKERENIKLYYEILYNQDISPRMLDKLIHHKRKNKFPDKKQIDEKLGNFYWGAKVT